MKQLLLENGWFIMPFLVLQAIGLYIIPFEDKLELFVSLNGVDHSTLNWLFKLLTKTAEWYGWVGVTFIAVLVRIRWAIYSVLALTTSGLISQLLKRKVFPEEMRPSHFLSETQMQTVEGVELHTRFSFPSGHTTGAFVIFLVLTLLLPKKYKPFGLLFFLIALAVGYSRIYLGQHFPIDVLAGSGLGVVVALLVYWMVNAFFDRKAYSWAEKSLISLFSPVS